MVEQVERVDGTISVQVHRRDEFDQGYSGSRPVVRALRGVGRPRVAADQNKSMDRPHHLLPTRFLHRGVASFHQRRTTRLEAGIPFVASLTYFLSAIPLPPAVNRSISLLYHLKWDFNRSDRRSDLELGPDEDCLPRARWRLICSDSQTVVSGENSRPSSFSIGLGSGYFQRLAIHVRHRRANQTDAFRISF